MNIYQLTEQQLTTKLDNLKADNKYIEHKLKSIQEVLHGRVGSYQTSNNRTQ